MSSKEGQTSGPGPKHLAALDQSVIDQCIHCGLCLPTCPTYALTLAERSSPRGRIALSRAVVDGALPVSATFGREMYFCLGCLACQTACPAGVQYGFIFEHARADAEDAGVLQNPTRNVIRFLTLKVLFTRPRLLRALGRLIWFYERSGIQRLVRSSPAQRLLPKRLRQLEALTPRIEPHFSDALIAPRECAKEKRYVVGLLTGCVQDLAYPSINRDTADVLLANGCDVVAPRAQSCCGSLHGHNGDVETARMLARRNIEAFHVEALDAIITNAGGCGTHLKNYGHLLADDPVYSERARLWSEKVKDIHEWLVQIGVRKPASRPEPVRATYHESCHLCHGQKITQQPRTLLNLVPGLELRELPESNWCCGSAGVYNLTHPDAAMELLERKMSHIEETGATTIATANTGCLVQLEAGARMRQKSLRVTHPISLLAEAYRREGRAPHL